MAVKMRLMRMGKKKSPYYRVVVMDGRAPRDGRYIDLIGRYDPKQEPSFVEIDNDKAVDWLSKGAQPTETVAKLLEISGAMSRFKVAAGRIHTVAGQAVAETGQAGEETVEEPVVAADDDAVRAEVPGADGADVDTAEESSDADGEEE